MPVERYKGTKREVSEKLFTHFSLILATFTARISVMVSSVSRGYVRGEMR